MRYSSGRCRRLASTVFVSFCLSCFLFSFAGERRTRRDEGKAKTANESPGSDGLVVLWVVKLPAHLFLFHVLLSGLCLVDPRRPLWHAACLQWASQSRDTGQEVLGEERLEWLFGSEANNIAMQKNTPATDNENIPAARRRDKEITDCGTYSCNNFDMSCLCSRCGSRTATERIGVSKRMEGEGAAQ